MEAGVGVSSPPAARCGPAGHCGLGAEGWGLGESGKALLHKPGNRAGRAGEGAERA